MINDITKEPTAENRILLALEALVGEGSLDERLKVVHVLVDALPPESMLWPFDQWLNFNKEWSENEAVDVARGLLDAVLTNYRTELKQRNSDIKALTADREEQIKERRAWAETAKAKTHELITCVGELDKEKVATRRLLGDIDKYTRKLTQLTKQRDRLQGKLDAADGVTLKESTHEYRRARATALHRKPTKAAPRRPYGKGEPKDKKPTKVQVRRAKAMDL